AFADEPERLARRELEADVIHRLHGFLGAAEEPGFHGEMHLQIFDLEEAHRARVDGIRAGAKSKKGLSMDGFKKPCRWRRIFLGCQSVRERALSSVVEHYLH